MTRKILVACVAGAVLLVMLGGGSLLLASSGGEVDAAVEGQVTTAGTGNYTIQVPWPSGWISQMYIDANVTKKLASCHFNYEMIAPLIHIEYFTMSTTSYKWMSSSGNHVSHALVVGESSTFDFADAPLADNPKEMLDYMTKNLSGFAAWGEGMAAQMGMYAPVFKKGDVLPFAQDGGKYGAYWVEVWGHFASEPANWDFLLVPLSKDQCFVIWMHSYGMNEDEILHVLMNAKISSGK
jgi:hypothetical protein